jgi:hypothetical protein
VCDTCCLCYTLLRNSLYTKNNTSLVTANCKPLFLLLLSTQRNKQRRLLNCTHCYQVDCVAFWLIINISLDNLIENSFFLGYYAVSLTSRSKTFLLKFSYRSFSDAVSYPRGKMGCWPTWPWKCQDRAFVLRHRRSFDSEDGSSGFVRNMGVHLALLYTVSHPRRSQHESSPAWKLDNYKTEIFYSLYFFRNKRLYARSVRFLYCAGNLWLQPDIALQCRLAVVGNWRKQLFSPYFFTHLCPMRRIWDASDSSLRFEYRLSWPMQFVICSSRLRQMPY